MADKRCPMCGKLNPEGLDVCQYCEARLKPLNVSDSPDESSDDLEGRTDLSDRSTLGWEDDPDTEGESSFEDEADAQGWLDRLRSDEEAEPSSPDDVEPASDEEVFSGSNDWLQRIRALHEANQDPEDTETADQEDAEDSWRFDSEPDGETMDEDLTGEDLPDWLRKLEPEKDGQPDEELDGDAALPDWLTRGTGSDEEEIFESLEAADKEESSSEMQTSEEDVDDLFSRLGSNQDFDKADSSDEETVRLSKGSDEDQELPDWLTGAEEEQTFAVPASPEESEQERLPKEEEVLPAWLAGLPSSSDLEGDQTKRDEEPEWLPEADEEEKSLVSDEEGEIPQWLTDLGQTDSEAEKAETAVWENENFQDWFSDLEEEETPSEESVEDEASETDEEIPGWLKNLGSVVTGTVEDDSVDEIEEGPVLPFVTEDIQEEDLLDVESLPEWLAPETGADDLGSAGDSDLAPADLPGWLAAMRPVEEDAQVRPLDEDDVESAGPLSGLRGVLPAEPDIIQFKKPSVYSAKLRITETQQSHIEVIRKVLASEGEPGSIPEPSLLSTQRALRWIIAFLLIVGVGFVVLGGSQVVPYPGINSIPDGTLAASRIISAIPDQAPVLLAFDYEPGTSGEMHAAAAALVDHMMLRGARLSLVSTLPTGPGLGEYFITNIQAVHDYVDGEQYTNLGYIPGGATGLLSFAQTPRWVTQYSYEGVNPWDSDLLRDIESLSDFAVVVVITDDADVARDWIEQVQPRLGNTPLLMVVSAKIEPMVRPYYGDGLNRQVSGMVSGITGGVGYEIAVGKANLGRDYWDAFSVGLILIVAVIVFGGTINTIQYLFSLNKPNEHEGTG